MNINACLSHNSDEWATPKDLYDTFISKGFVDPCPLGGTDNALTKSFINSRLFVNPPFSKLKDFSNWCIEQAKNNCDIFLLMPVRTDTKYFKLLFDYGIAEIIFIHKRLKFNDYRSAPFNSMVLHINKNRSMVCKLFTCDQLINYINDLY